MIYGLLAALGWGLSDLLAAIVARRMGSRATVVAAQTAALLGLGGLTIVASPLWDITLAHTLLLVGSGCFAGVAYFALYRGMELGPVVLVSPIASAFALVVVLLAVVVLGESLSAGQLTGIFLTLGGVLLASTDLRLLGVQARLHKKGIPFGIAAMIGFGVAAFGSAAFAKRYGYLPPITLSRVGSLVLIAAVIAATWGREGGAVHVSRRNLPLAVLVGLTDIAGIAFYARGSELGFVSVVVAASATFTLLPAIGGIVLFDERPAPNQVLGVVLVMVGLLALGWAS